VDEDERQTLTGVVILDQGTAGNLDSHGRVSQLKIAGMANPQAKDPGQKMGNRIEAALPLSLIFLPPIFLPVPV
jgi:hypothetical protein